MTPSDADTPRAETPLRPPEVWYHAKHGLHDEAHHQVHRPLDLCVPLDYATPERRAARSTPDPAGAGLREALRLTTDRLPKWTHGKYKPERIRHDIGIESPVIHPASESCPFCALAQSSDGSLDAAGLPDGPDLVFSTSPAPEGIDTDCMFLASPDRISVHISRRAINAQAARLTEHSDAGEPEPGSEYGRLLAERDRLIAGGVEPADLDLPLAPGPVPDAGEGEDHAH